MKVNKIVQFLILKIFFIIFNTQILSKIQFDPVQNQAKLMDRTRVLYFHERLFVIFYEYSLNIMSCYYLNTLITISLQYIITLRPI